MMPPDLSHRVGALWRNPRAMLREHPWLSAIVGLTWLLVVMRVLFWHTPILPIMFNWSDSLPFNVVVVDSLRGPYHRGDLIVFAFRGPAVAAGRPGLNGQALLKYVAGVAGDAITVNGREVFVNGVSVGVARDRDRNRRSLDPITPVTIPPGKLYVMGTSPTSFDSRYSATGLVDERDVLARVRPLF